MSQDTHVCVTHKFSSGASGKWLRMLSQSHTGAQGNRPTSLLEGQKTIRILVNLIIVNSLVSFQRVHDTSRDKGMKLMDAEMNALYARVHK